ncbi:inactive N-acetylated-alpha-linked acidic dipeptidase-like protein 2 [Cebidichthys violaceus]|uniref:inactive N-acetylated-alpha-linked acidic dipeptidase-like protein 2 n=1 Tax=Cebidichthys violaceus TaxID=271503 RepID=UPI0035C99588
MAYRKVCDAQGGPMVSEVMHCSGGLDLDWDLDKEELQEPGPSMDRMQLQHVDCQRSGCSDPGPDPDPELMEPIQQSVSVSPHGRFERLQEDPNYISHFTRAPGHKGQRLLHCFLLRYFLAGVGLFVMGLLIGWFTHTPTGKPPAPPSSDSSDLLEELLRGITADKIDALHRGTTTPVCHSLGTVPDLHTMLKRRQGLYRYVLVGSRHDSDQGGGPSAIMNQLIAALTEQTKRGWVPDRTTVFCSWGGSTQGNIGSYEWGKDNNVILQSSAVAYISLYSPVRGTETLRATASPALLQLTSDIQRRELLSCIRGGNCPGPNVSSLQLPGDVNFFANQLAVPTMEFAFEPTKADETTGFLSENQYSAESPETLDPLFKFHETIAKMTAEAILRLVNDPVLPFYPLDIALDIQNKLKDNSLVTQPMLSSASSLRDHAAFFQSETMRPANDPKERDPSHVRMLNDVLRDLEKSFLIPQTPPGVYRNLLYSLPEKTPQFSILRFSQEAVLHCNVTSKAVKHNSADKEILCQNTMNQSLSLILRAIRSAERLVCFGLDLFENYPNDTI